MRPCLHVDGHRHRHRLDREPLSCPTGRPNTFWPRSITSPPRCRSRSWAWTPTTDRNSSTTTCWHGAASRQITFTRSRPGNKNDGCHVEQKNWAVVRTVVGYYRYDTASELLLLNEIWQLQSQADQLLPPPAETGLQSPHRRQGVQETRQGHHPVSPRDRPPEHDRGTHRGAQAGPTR